MDIKARKKFYLQVLLFLLILWTLFFIFLLYRNRVIVKLNGEEIINTTIYNGYVDKGFTIKKNNKSINIKNIKIKNNVNIKKLGTYKVTYSFKYIGKKYILKRIVNVVDDIKPEIIVNVDSIERDYCTKGNINEFSYSVIDNYDKDISKKLKYKEKDDQVILEVTDLSNNRTIKKVPIVYSDEPEPTFELNGNETLYVTKNNNYKELGSKYIDGCGNDLSDKISVSGKVDTTNIGEYKIKYKVKDKEKVRNVIVYNPNVKGVLENDKVIYLTFDDGPGYYTNKVLDILNKYGIKATFFVTHQFNSYIHLIKEEKNQGHEIGVHTYTHKWDVYTDLNTYLDDFNKMNDTIYEFTGVKSKIFRFPGGSSNTISKGIKEGIVSEIAEKMTNDGYVYFDWNLDSNDASSANEEQIYNNVINGVNTCDNCVILMHDIKPTTANALDSILDTLTSNGYKFGVLTENSFEVHHKINN